MRRNIIAACSALTFLALLILISIALWVVLMIFNIGTGEFITAYATILSFFVLMTVYKMAKAEQEAQVALQEISKILETLEDKLNQKEEK